jgi:hypothetical protein
MEQLHGDTETKCRESLCRMYIYLSLLFFMSLQGDQGNFRLATHGHLLFLSKALLTYTGCLWQSSGSQQCFSRDLALYWSSVIPRH